MDQENQGFIQSDTANQSQGTASASDKIQQSLEKFREFPPKIQFMIIAGVVFFLFIIFAGGSDDKPKQPPVVQKTSQKSNTANTTNVGVINQNVNDSFSQINPERGTLQRGFFEEQRRIISDRLGGVEDKVDSKMSEVKEIQESIAKQARQLNQMIENFNEQMKAMEKVNRGSLEEIRKIAEESKNRNLRSPNIQNGGSQGFRSQQGGGRNPKSGRNKPIKQIILQDDGSGASRNVGDPLLGGLVNGLNGNLSSQTIQAQIEADTTEPAPFIPPLGFIRGTLLNGFDALAGAGAPTPALIRLSGRYKTAMNSTVNLNGCFMLAEFEGDLSTERAFGTPARMTCVYPDQGAVTYNIAGYVVDEKDGIVGIPGVFYEGDPARLAAAMIADFTASLSDVIRSNQSTTSTSTLGGTSQNAITGDQSKAALAGGISGAVGSLRDYLSERANRIVPFVRVDATRDLHIVILEGVELRQQGKPWTLLVNGENADQLQVQKQQRLQQLRQAQQNPTGR